jgi:hypothetical protein
MTIKRPICGKKPTAVWDELDPLPPKRPVRRLRRKVTPISAIVIPVIILITLTVSAGLLLPFFLFEQDFDYTHMYAPPDANSGNGFADLAGEYGLGGLGLQWALSILPDGRYSFRWSGCGGVYHRESGFVKRVGEHLVISAVDPIKRRIPRVLLPVKWGRRTYLLPPEELGKFSEAIMKGDEPRNEYSTGYFYVKGGAEPVGGLPELPQQWAIFLRKNVVTGTIVDESERGRAKINFGSADGISPESILTVQGWGLEHCFVQHLTLVAVNEHSSVVENVYPGEYRTPLSVGDYVVGTRQTPSP